MTTEQRMLFCSRATGRKKTRLGEPGHQGRKKTRLGEPGHQKTRLGEPGHQIRRRLGEPGHLLIAFAAVVFAAGLMGGCSEDRFARPRSLLAPYGTANEEVLWAVAPLRNESGVTHFDLLMLTDRLAQQIEQVHGISVVPVNRVIAAMRALGIEFVSSPAEALHLANTLGVQAIVVGTVTAWDPYDPPEFGLSLALFGAGQSMGGQTRVDPLALQASSTDYRLYDGPMEDPFAPLASASEHLDGANHEIQMAVRSFAEGRHDPKSPFGWRRYLASMSLFTEFGCYRLTERLLDAERLRLAQPHASVSSPR